MKVARRDITLVVIVTILLTSTIVLGYFIFKEDKKKESDLKVEDVYFLMEGSNTERSQIEIIVFISNIGDKDVEKLEIRAFTVEAGSNLAMDDFSATINDVKQKTTVEGNLLVDIPNNDSYRMELLIFKDDKLEIRGSGTIDLTGIGASYDYRNYPSYVDDDDDDSGGMSADAASFSWFGGICVMLLIAGVIIGIIVYAVVKAEKKPPGGGEGSIREGGPRQYRRMEPRLEEFGVGPDEETELERRKPRRDRPAPERLAPPLKEEKMEPDDGPKSKP